MTGMDKTKSENSGLAENGIVVTEAMIEAGVSELLSWVHDWDCERQIVSAVFSEMTKVQSAR